MERFEAKVSRIALFGGTFDPIHNAHLQACLDIRTALELDCVHLTPCFQPVHRDNPGASAEQRLSMLNLAVGDKAGICVDSREITRGGPSYSIDTLLSIQKTEQPQRLFLVVGIDAFNGFMRWHQWQDILSVCHVVVMSRPGASLTPEVLKLLATRQIRPDETERSASGGIIYLKVTAMAVSATKVRNAIANQEPIDYLVPFPVAEYIKNNNLYVR